MTEPTTAGDAALGGEAAPVVSGREGPGRLVRAARERAGLSLDDLAMQTRLAHETLEAIENDDFKVLDESVYVRGYYRKCAKILKLPEDELIAAYDRLALPKSAAVPSKLLLSGSESGRRSMIVPVRWIAIVVGVIAAVAAVVMLVMRNDSSKSLLTTIESTSPASTSVPAAATAATEPASAPVAETPAPTPAAPTESTIQSFPPASPAPTPPSPAPAAAAPEVAPAPHPVAPVAHANTTAVPATAATGEPAATSLVLELRSHSWVEVRDATGKTLISGMVKGGVKKTFEGQPPFSVFLGNAPAVDVQYQGAGVKLEPYITQKSTARFTVP
jgi:cytoskeleton protein RodZ